MDMSASAEDLVNLTNDDPDSPRISNSSFSYTLARHLLRLPSRVLSRMRRLDQVPPLGQSDAATADDNTGAHARAQQRLRDSGITPLPGPWGFLTSGYFFGLFFMVSFLSYQQRLISLWRLGFPSQQGAEHCCAP